MTSPDFHLFNPAVCLSERAAKNKTGMKSFYGLALRRQGVNGVRNKMLRDKFKVYIFIASVAI